MNNWPDVIRFVVQLFCVATMFAMGLGITLDDIKAPFRNPLALAIIIVVNNLLIPILGIVIVLIASVPQVGPLATLAGEIVPLNGGHQLGFLLLFLGAGTVVSPFLARIAGAPLAFTRGTMVVLVGVSAILVPILLNLLAQFGNLLVGTAAALPIGAVFITLLIYQLVPLAVGILIKSQYSVIARRLRPLIVVLTGLSFLVAVAAVAASTPGLFSLPATASGAPTLVAATQVPTSTAALRAADVLDGVEQKVDTQKLPKERAIAPLAEASRWVLYDRSTAYRIIAAGRDIAPKLVIVATAEPTQAFTLTLTVPAFQNRVKELNAGQFSQALAREFEQRPDFSNITANQIAILENGARWVLVNATSTYYIAAEDDPQTGNAQLVITQQLPEAPQLLLPFLQGLEGLPVLDPVIDFLGGLIVVLLPYAMFVAIVALLLIIGNAGGTIIRSLVEVKGEGIPHAVAIETAVRNVSIALIIAANYLIGLPDQDNGGDLGQNATAVILAFFLVSLIVTAHQAVQWGKQAKAAVTVVETPEPASSAPRVFNA